MATDDKDPRTSEQIRNAVTAGAKLAQQVGHDRMATPQDRIMRDELHKMIDRDLTTLENRRSI